MAFAIFYNRQDLSPIAAEFTKGSLSGQDRSYARSVWNAGLSGWDTAPQAPAEYLQGDPDTRILVITSGTKQEMRDFLYRMCNNNQGAVYMCAIADDMAGTAIEPWPIV